MVGEGSGCFRSVPRRSENSGRILGAMIVVKSRVVKLENWGVIMNDAE
jgi:hypothetical protein